MKFKNRKFAIINTEEINKIIFSEILEESESLIRYNNQKDRIIFKWEEQTPSFLNNLDTLEGPYEHHEILLILKSPEWNKPL